MTLGNPNGEVQRQGRVLYIDFLRILAAFLVIVNHTNSRIFLGVEPSLTWYTSLSYFFVCKIAVPIFFMIMGATLLGKQDPPQKWGMRMLRIVCVGLIFSFLYYVYYRRHSLETFSFLEFLTELVTARTTTAFWYLYAYLGLLIGLPLFRKMAAAFSKAEHQLLLLMSLGILGIYPIIGTFTSIWLNQSFTSVFISPYVGLVFAGYYIERFVKIDKKQFFLALGTFMILIVLQVLGTRYFYGKDPKSYLELDDRTFLTITASAACVYVMVKYLFSVVRIPQWLGRTIVYMGGLTFGVYLFSDMAINLTASWFTDLCQWMHKMPAMLIWEAAILVITMAVTALLRCIPWLRRWI